MKSLRTISYFAVFASVTTSFLALQGCGEHLAIRKGMPVVQVAGVQKPAVTPLPDPQRQAAPKQSVNPKSGLDTKIPAKERKVPNQKSAQGNVKNTSKNCDSKTSLVPTNQTIKMELPYAKSLSFTVEDLKVTIQLEKVSISVQDKKAVAAVRLKVNKKTLDLVTAHKLRSKSTQLDLAPFRLEKFPYQINTLGQCVANSSASNNCDNYIMIVQLIDDGFLSSLTGNTVLREFAVVVSPKAPFNSGLLVLNKKSPETLPTLSFLAILKDSLGL